MRPAIPLARVCDANDVWCPALLFAVEDLFAVGLGLDIAGGYLVARGLLTDDADLATVRTFAGMGAQSTVARVQDRVDASFGLLYLGAGFALQAAGYAASEAGAGSGSPGLEPFVVFVALAALAVVVALTLHRRLSPRRVRALALKVTLLDGYGLPVDTPEGRDLLDLGVEFGDDARDDETYGDYAKRVWDIARVSEPDAVPDESARRRRQPGRKQPR